MNKLAIIKISNKDIKIFESLLNESFTHYDIKLINDLYYLEVNDESSFLLKLKKIHQIAVLDFNINSSILVVPSFNDSFNKYIDKFSNDVFTIYDLFLSNIKEDYVINDCKKILSSISKDNINTIKAYIDCNLDANSAAEELYLHRNSFAYRIKKFSSDTGFDYHDINTIMFLNLLISLIK